MSLDTSIELAQPFARDLEAALELAAEWGVPTVRVFGGSAGSPDDIASRLEQGARPRGGARRHGSHWRRTTRLQALRSSPTLLRRVESPSFAALWDVHHPYRVGESPEDVVRALGSRIRLVHIKDARRRGDDWQLVPLGEGEVPVRESLAALRAAGYDGWLTVEWEKRWHPELAEPEDALPRELETLVRWLWPPYEKSGTRFRLAASSSIVSSDGRDS